MDRRDFLKKGTAAAGFAVSGGMTLPQTHAGEPATRKYSGDPQSQIVIENPNFRLVINEDGTAESLIHKETAQECLARNARTPVLTVTQDRPYLNELQLSYPAKKTVFGAKSVRREGDRLFVRFDRVDHLVVVRLKITIFYIGFSVEKIDGTTPLDEITFLQLPVRARANFGEWLNVAWDADVAVNLLATDPTARIDSEEREGYHLLRAAATGDVRLEGVGAALIATRTVNLLDHIAQLEADFQLPKGVKSRRSEEQRWSYLEASDITPANAAEYIRYAKTAGFRAMVVYYLSFCKSVGHFPWKPEYPNQMADLQAVVAEIKKAGLLPGFHFHYNKADKADPYVTPVPDDRLNFVRTFTLASPVDAQADTLTVLETPQGCTRDEGRRLLKIGKEIVSYRDYETGPRYRFIGCKRGELGTRARAHDAGTIFGLLNVDTWPRFVRFSQNTDIQEEVAQRLAKIYREAGFQFAYFDGAEDVPPPYWYTVSKAQWEVYRLLEPEPLFAEGACKSHFSWHLLNRGNAFDVFKPEIMKSATRQWPMAEAARNARDFSRLDFGWMGYWVPDATTIGTQPDMVEYLESRAAAWDCPISFNSSLEKLRAHPRTPDNLEVMRRWEEVRYRHWLSEEQKAELRDPDQEHILLIDEKKQFELVPYTEVLNVAGGKGDIRAFTFERQESIHVVYWHTSGHSSLVIAPLETRVRLLPDLFEDGLPIHESAAGMVLPAAGRRYLKCPRATREQVIRAFQEATIGSDS